MQPLPDLGNWCDFCNEKIAVATSADGISACTECAREWMEAEARVQAELAEAAGLHVGPNRKQRRAARRAALRRNDGKAKQ